ncbi:MAG: electron transfer flavoprotein subunit beta/FixA family protein [Spirochaetales bacterium]|nr:electron transfer flavoprotein subunit beta/FixA family protein [Spirochaetales bacterium]
MKIAVLIKPVPNPEEYHRITIDPETKRLNREGIPSIVNPADRCAVEEALKICESAGGGEVVIFAMAPPDGKEKIVELLAMGADRGVLVSDRAFGGADTLVTAYTLGEALKKEGAFDLILAGNESADGATGHVPTQVGEYLGYSHLTTIRGITVEGEKTLLVEQKLENGSNFFRMQLPAVIGVTRDINVPRYTSAIGVMKARKKPLEVWGVDDLDVDRVKIGLGGSPTQPGAIYAPENSRECKLIDGTPEDAAEEILRIIKGAGIVTSGGKR